jgi:hypothetical protein
LFLFCILGAGGVAPDGRNILELFAEDAQVYFPKWGIATGHTQISELFADLGERLISITHDYAHFNPMEAREHVYD